MVMVHKIIVGESFGYDELGCEVLQMVMKDEHNMDVTVERTRKRAELLEKVKIGDYSVVLVGCCMDGEYGSQSGLDVVKELRKLNKKLPIYFVAEGCFRSVQPFYGDLKSMALEAGANKYFTRLTDWDTTIPAAIATHLVNPK
jgi:CheY-like chemotaxis protein